MFVTGALEQRDGRLIRVAEVAMEARVGGNAAVYTYRATVETQVGQAYLAPLGTRTVIGFVIELSEITPDALGFSETSLRALGKPVDGLRLPEAIIELVRFVAAQTLCPVPVALAMATPPGVAGRLCTSYEAVREPTLAVSAVLREAYAALMDTGGRLTETRSKPLAAGARKALRALSQKGYVRESFGLARASEKRRMDGLFRVNPDERKVDGFLKSQGKRKPAQAMTLMRIQGSEASSFTAQEIKALGMVTDQTVRALLQAGLLEKVEPEWSGASIPPMPNLDQASAIDTVSRAIRQKRHVPFLLFGITGSGKTEVFLRCAAEALKSGRTVLYVVPEIALTAQVISQLRSRFGRSVAVLHSNLAPSERLEQWLRVQSGEAPVVLGARSALFAPISNLGLIVMDEEHESSYKQDAAPRYHAKAIAELLGSFWKCPVLLGSATPSVETFYETERGARTLLELPSRTAASRLPEVVVQDMTELFAGGRPSLFSVELRREISLTLQRGEQVILFLNRRAYAPFVMCRSCGYRFECPHCSVTLSFHRRALLMKCHHCGYAKAYSSDCPTCLSNKVKPFGAGTERVEELISAEFPDAKVARLDRDVARRKGALEETFASFRSGETQILVGTQIVAKGLDFPNVTLVGVVAADLSLGIPDFRASERTFQLLSQVGGRAGRGKASGKVIVQTFNPLTAAVSFAQQHDYIRFFRHTLQERREAAYPPFVRLVNIVFAGEVRGEVQDAAEDARCLLAAGMPEARMVGPIECPLERLHGKWRSHILIRLKLEDSLSPLRHWSEGFTPLRVQVTVDIDPYSLM